MDKLKGKYAVITGAGQGIGKAIAQRFVDEGVKGIALLDYNGPAVKQTEAELSERCSEILALTCDVSNKTQVEECMSAVISAFGTVDILVNNAGIIRDAMFHKMSVEQWETVVNTNLNSLYYVTRCVIGLMRQKRAGNIINISSIASAGSVGQTNYSAAKAGVIAFTVALAKESAGRQIRVNCISPGFIDTEILKAMPPDALEQVIAAAPAKRLGSPDEIAKTAVFLASDDSSFVSGVNLTVSFTGRNLS
jgi:3-oxoacyl-[acyl-carrier protein] reductase